MFATIAGLVTGLLLGRRRSAYALTTIAWYVCLAAQTIYLAKPGASDFAGHSGNATIRWPIYWIVQPPILALAVSLLLVGSWLRTRLLKKLHPANALHEQVATRT
jgi:hypothetical protein